MTSVNDGPWRSPQYREPRIANPPHYRVTLNHRSPDTEFMNYAPYARKYSHLSIAIQTQNSLNMHVSIHTEASLSRHRFHELCK